MARITALTPKPRDPSLVDVSIDGERVGTALRSALDDLGLREGSAISAKGRASLMSACERATARTVALKSLGRSDRSRATLARILVERHAIGEEAAAATLDQLKADGWQDDRRYAEGRARILAEERGCSRAFIAESLAAEGIDERLASKVAKAAAPSAKERERAEAIARRALGGGSTAAVRGRKQPATGGARATARQGRSQMARRIGSQLARRGFDADTIAHVLDRLGLADAES